MSITDELREWTLNHTVNCSDNRIALVEIIDHIDAEHEKTEDEWKAKNGQMWLKGYSACHAELMEGNEAIAADMEKAGWVRGPLDADDKPWCIGDVIAWPDGSGFKSVIGIGKDCLFYIDSECEHKADWTVAHDKHHPPTVEDVLMEFADRVYNSGHQWGLDAADTIAEYAAKLRLAGEDE